MESTHPAKSNAQSPAFAIIIIIIINKIPDPKKAMRLFPGNLHQPDQLPKVPARTNQELSTPFNICSLLRGRDNPSTSIDDTNSSSCNHGNRPRCNLTTGTSKKHDAKSLQVDTKWAQQVGTWCITLTGSEKRHKNNAKTMHKINVNFHAGCDGNGQPY